MSTNINLNGIDETDLNLAGTVTATLTAPGKVTVGQTITASDITNVADVTKANIFALLNTFTDGIKIGNGSSYGELLFTASTLSIQALIGTTPVILGLQLPNSTTAANVLESNTAEIAYGLETIISGTPYVGVAQVETNVSNFISATNTIEYQVGAQKAGSGPIPPFTFAVGDNVIATTKPVIAPSFEAGNGAAGTFTLAALTTGGTQGSITIAGGIVTAFTPST